MPKDFKAVINEVLQKCYPIPDNFDNISQLSHFHIENLIDFQQWLPFMMDIRGVILSGRFQGQRIQKVQTADYNSYTWKQYIAFFHSVLHLSHHYCINPQKFFWYLHTFPNIKMLRIANIRFQYSNAFSIPIVYTKTPCYQIPWYDGLCPSTTNIPNYPKLHHDNHFYLNSFDVKSNQHQLTHELKRLFLHRDEYEDIHFHLDGNGGGDNTPGQLIVRCLVGPRESWMKPVTKILKNKTEITWDEWSDKSPEEYACGNAYSEGRCRSPEEYACGNAYSEGRCRSPEEYDVVEALQLGNIPTYDTKYSGKIYVYMNPQNDNAAWFFITYLIYAFAKKQDIIRHHSSCFENTYKHGIVLPYHQLILRGKSGTTSGDGNPEPIVVRKNDTNILVQCPTEQIISSSILPKDWNRYWSEG
jgi:hypothetical protein